MSATARGWQASLLLHALLIGSFALLNIGLATSPQPMTIELSFITGAPAAADAAAPPPAKPLRQAVPAKPKPQVQKQQEQSAPLPVAEKELTAEMVMAEEATMEPEVAANGDTTAVAVEGGSTGDPQAYVREHFAYIRNLVMHSLGYPALAQRMGWSGRVVIAFTILEDGAVCDMRVEESSGKKLLDENALATVLRVAPFPPPPVPAQIVMPINYRLN